MKYPPGEAFEFRLVPLGPNQRAWDHLLGEWMVWALSEWDTVDPCSHCLCKRSSRVVAWPTFCHTHCPIATCYQNKTSCYTTFLFCSYIFVQRDYKNDNLLHLKMHVFQVRHIPWCWEVQYGGGVVEPPLVFRHYELHWCFKGSGVTVERTFHLWYRGHALIPRGCDILVISTPGAKLYVWIKSQQNVHFPARCQT